MNDRLSFAIFLETAGPSGNAGRWQRHFGDAAVEASCTSWSAKILGPQTTRENVQVALGPPDFHDDFTVSYLLPTRHSYVYTFEFDPKSGRLMESGFQRVMTRVETSDPTEHRDKPGTLGATSTELRARLGEPINKNGWWPWETWEYPGGLTLQLRHGIVEDVEGMQEKSTA